METNCGTCYDTHQIDQGGREIACPDCSVSILLKDVTDSQKEIIDIIEANSRFVTVEWKSKRQVILSGRSRNGICRAIDNAGAVATRAARRAGRSGRGLPSLQVNNLISKVEAAR